MTFWEDKQMKSKSDITAVAANSLFETDLFKTTFWANKQVNCFCRCSQNECIDVRVRNLNSHLMTVPFMIPEIVTGATQAQRNRSR
jgi:hypothetical protein